MIKLIVMVKRNAAMSPAQFHQYWRVGHARKVGSITACAKYVRGYVQAHALDSEYAAGDPACDGTAELRFDSVQDKDAFFSDPEHLAIVAPDEPVFADMNLSRFLLTNEARIVQAVGNRGASATASVVGAPVAGIGPVDVAAFADPEAVEPPQPGDAR
jgi:uncharacterized protein (TIGR02118 family)